MPQMPYLGQIMPAGFGIIPKGWAPCNGMLLAIQTNTALFSLLGVTYGGDGRTTFALPDLRGRAVLGSNFGSVPWGQVSGTESVTVSSGQLPAHNHVIQASTATGSGGGRGGVNPTGNIFGTATQPAENIFAIAGSMEIGLSIGTNIVNTGGNQPHNNMQPSLVINYVIATQGLYPPRP